MTECDRRGAEGWSQTGSPCRSVDPASHRIDCIHIDRAQWYSVAAAVVRARTVLESSGTLTAGSPFPATTHDLTRALQALLESLEWLPDVAPSKHAAPFTEQEREFLEAAGVRVETLPALTGAQLRAERLKYDCMVGQRRNELACWYVGEDGRPLPHLDDALHAFPRDWDWLDIGTFMTAPTDELDDLSPRDWLESGQPPAPLITLILAMARPP